MPGEVLHSLPEDHRPPMGCMAGIFQTFIRRYALSHRRRLGNQVANYYDSSPSSLSSSFFSSGSSRNDSVRREKRVITVKEAEGKALKFIDSPRPDRKKILEASRRFSLDESEFRYSTATLKEVPRFSLDSRFENVDAVLCTTKSSVIIKLMGLETLPVPGAGNGAAHGESTRRERNTRSYIIKDEKFSESSTPCEDIVVVKQMTESAKRSVPQSPKGEISTKQKPRRTQTRNAFSRNQQKKTPKKPEKQFRPLPPNSAAKFEWSFQRRQNNRIENPRLGHLGEMKMKNCWTGKEEVPEIVLELERRIFRDLIRDEILQRNDTV